MGSGWTASPEFRVSRQKQNSGNLKFEFHAATPQHSSLNPQCRAAVRNLIPVRHATSASDIILLAMWRVCFLCPLHFPLTRWTFFSPAPICVFCVRTNACLPTHSAHLVRACSCALYFRHHHRGRTRTAAGSSSSRGGQGRRRPPSRWCRHRHGTADGPASAVRDNVQQQQQQQQCCCCRRYCSCSRFRGACQLHYAARGA